MPDPITVLVWTFVAVFVLTCFITLTGIIDNFKWIEVKENYLKGLYAALILEVIIAGLAIVSGKLDPLLFNNTTTDLTKIENIEGPESVGALITDCVNNKPSMLLVLHDKDGRIVYSPPAGGIRVQDSNIYNAAIRETKEETGYYITSDRELGNSPRGNLNFKMVIGKVDKSKQPDPFFHETIGIIWCNPQDIPVDSWRFPEQRKWIIELYQENAPTNCK